MMHSLYGTLATQEQLMQAAAAAAIVDPLMANRDTTFTKIFVGGLPYHTTDKTLHEYFEQFGEIEEAVVITDRQTQKSRGYGFVTMKDRASAERACKEPNPIIDGRKANVNLAYLGAKPRGNLQLAALSSGMQLPLQTQLQALFPNRLGLPQLYYPTASSLGHGLVIPSVSPLSATTATVSPAVSVSNTQHYLDYATLAAAQNAYAAHPSLGGAAATGYEQYAYSPYGMIPASYAAQLTAQSVAASQHGVGSTDNGARVQ